MPKYSKRLIDCALALCKPQEATKGETAAGCKLEKKQGASTRLWSYGLDVLDALYASRISPRKVEPPLAMNQ